MPGPDRDPPASGAAPETFYDLFRGVNSASFDCLLTGAVALTLHGIPRLSNDVDLLSGSAVETIEKAHTLLGSWGYQERLVATENPPGLRVLRFAHFTSPIGEIDLVLLPVETYAALRRRAVVFRLIDTPVRAVSRPDLRRYKEASDHQQDREDAADIRILESVLRGEGGGTGDGRREQIVKFQSWHTENRCEWLLSALRLKRGLPPERRAPPNPRFRRTNPWRGR